MKNIFIIAFTGLISLASCGKKDCENEFSWEIPAVFSPAKDTFNIGDTISISSIFNDRVYEQFRGEEYKLIDYNFYPKCSLIQIDSVPPPEQVSGDLSEYASLIVDSIYTFYLNNDYSGIEVALGEYTHWDNMYRLEFKLVLKRKGVYLFNFNTNVHDPTFGGQDFEGKCTNSDVFSNVVLNNRDSNNVQMLYDAYKAYPNGYVEWVLRDVQDHFHNKGGYVFYVKE
jgi:hypothetical protein